MNWSGGLHHAKKFEVITITVAGITKKKQPVCDLITGFSRALENLENHKKSSMHGKIMEFEKKKKSWKNHGIL